MRTTNPSSGTESTKRGISMGKKILIGAGAVILLLVVIIATRPATFHVERSITVAAPAETVFAEVNDFHAWTAWSPYEKLDPAMKRTYEGPVSGNGASYAWASTGHVGEGKMTILKSEKASQIVIELEFIKPFTATNTATFSFVPTADGTKVTWAMDGEKNFVAKAFHLVVDMDKMVGGDFERGLFELKVRAENAAKGASETAHAGAQ